MKDASELLEELENDPVYQERVAAKDERQKQLLEAAEVDHARIIKQLAGVGLDVTYLPDLVNSDMRFGPETVNVFLHGLQTSNDVGVRLTLVRALHGAEKPFDGTVLIRLFEEGTVDRWAIANLMASQVPTGIGPWLIHAVANPTYGTERSRLCTALAQAVSPKISRDILREVFRNFPHDAAEALGLIGGRSDIALLESVLDASTPQGCREVNAAIRKIKQRI